MGMWWEAALSSGRMLKVMEFPSGAVVLTLVGLVYPALVMAVLLISLSVVQADSFKEYSFK